MSGIHPSLAEVIHDEDRAQARKELNSLIRQMQQSGKKPRSILRALVDVMMEYALELPCAKRHYDFLTYVRDSAQDGIALFELFVDKERNTNH